VDEKTVWFFHGLTLLRRIIYVVRTERPDDTHRVVAALAESAADCLQRAVA
jgi:hypothetical protein